MSSAFTAVVPIANRPTNYSRKASAWRKLAAYRREARAKLREAEAHEERAALARVVRALKAHALESRRRNWHAARLGTKARRKRERALTTSLFSEWAGVCASKRKVADIHYARSYVEKWRSKAMVRARANRIGRRIESTRKQRLAWAALSQWYSSASTAYRRRELRMLDAAAEFDERATTTRNFRAWRRCAAQRASAKKHYRARALRGACSALRRYVLSRRRSRYTTLLMLRFRYRTIVGGAFAWWAKACRKRLFAAAFARRKLLGTAMCEWQAFAAHSAHKKKRTVLALEHRSSTLLSACLHSWQYATQMRKLVNSATEFFEAKSKRRGIRAWKGRVLKRQAHLALVKRATDHRETSICRTIIVQRWLPFVAARTQRRMRIERADSHRRSSALRHGLRGWRARAAQKMFQRTADAVALRDAREEMNASKLARAMGAWMEWYRRRCVWRFQLARAGSHHQTSLLRTVLREWRIWASAHHAKILLWGVAVRSDCSRIVAGCFCAWKARVVARQIHMENTIRALQHWATRMQANAFRAFVLNAKHAARKRARSNQAVEWRRNRLLKSGVSWWIRAAARYEAYADDLAIRAVASKSVALMQRVKKYARHWRAVVSRRKWMREGRIEVRKPMQRISYTKTPFTSRVERADIIDAQRRLQPSLSLEWIDDMIPRKVERPRPRCPADILQDISPNTHYHQMQQKSAPIPRTRVNTDLHRHENLQREQHHNNNRPGDEWCAKLDALLDCSFQMGIQNPSLPSLLREIAHLESEADAFRAAMPHIPDPRSRDAMRRRVDAFDAFKLSIAPKLRKLEDDIVAARRSRNNPEAAAAVA